MLSTVKILHVTHSIDPRGGGPIEGIRQLIPALAAHGIATEVLSLDAPGCPGTNDFPVPLYAMGPSRSKYGYIRQVVPWLKEHRANYSAIIVHGLWQYPGRAVWQALRDTSTPYYVYPHGMLDPWFKRTYPLKHLKKWLYWLWAEYRVLRDAEAVLFTCEEEMLEARKSFWFYRCREKVTGLGITSPPGDGSHQRDLFLEKFPDLRDKRIILFLGRIHEKKACDLLLRAWKSVIDRGQNHPTAHLVMAGPADDVYGAEMKSLAQTLDLGHAITWTGMITGDLKWGSLHAADAFILPSHQENLGIAVVEALACHVPVLISNKINIWREIEKDSAGLVENDDLEGTVRLLDRWMGLPLPERTVMRTQARNCFEQHFDIAQAAEKLALLLRR
jgi:glycosyltransferase involved in cell wall biosynthesis